MAEKVYGSGWFTLTLKAKTAADLMTAKVVSVRDVATLKEAIACFIDKGVSAAPVIDEAGHPVGVLSQTDIVIHDREKVRYLPAFTAPVAYEEFDLDEFQIEETDRTEVREVMTPVVFTVPALAPATSVIEEMCAMNVHRLFVVDASGVLVGVISTLDMLRHLEVRK
jgi:CBS-domain-containing membrane protein